MEICLQYLRGHSTKKTHFEVGILYFLSFSSFLCNAGSVQKKRSSQNLQNDPKDTKIGLHPKKLQP